MAPLLKTPFPYSEILIGEEIVYRALLQQREFALAGKYGMSWDTADQNLMLTMYYRAQVMRSSFSIPNEYQQCLPVPPCYWDKIDDRIGINQILPVMYQLLPTLIYKMEIYRRTDLPGESGYQTHEVLFDYSNDQSALDPSALSSFLYYVFTTPSPAVLGPAVFRTTMNPALPQAQQIDYLFTLVDGE